MNFFFISIFFFLLFPHLSSYFHFSIEYQKISVTPFSSSLWIRGHWRKRWSVKDKTYRTLVSMMKSISRVFVKGSLTVPEGHIVQLIRTVLYYFRLKCYCLIICVTIEVKENQNKEYDNKYHNLSLKKNRRLTGIFLV